MGGNVVESAKKEEVDDLAFISFISFFIASHLFIALESSVPFVAPLLFLRAA